MDQDDTPKQDGGAAVNERQEAQEATPAAPAAPVETSQPEEKVEKKDDVKPSIMDRARAMMKDKGAMQKEISGNKETIATLQKELDQAKVKIAEQDQELTSLRELKQDLESSVQELEAEKQTVSEAVTDELASLGVEKEVLPQQTEKQEETLEQLQERMKNTSCPKEKGKLAAKARELRWA